MLRQQLGVGLLEVLIALLLLAVAVLGFSAMQMRAVKATDETLFRSDALVAIRNISEDMRLYPTIEQRQKYQDYVALLNQQDPLDPLKSALTNCNTTACTSEQQMQFNAFQSVALARDNGIFINAMTCPGTEQATSLKKMCLVAAWGNTKPNMGSDKEDCTDATGVYNRGATCFVVEAY